MVYQDGKVFFSASSLFFVVDYHKVWSTGQELVIRLYLRIPEKFVHLILHDRSMVVHIPLVSIVKFKILVQFPVEHFLALLCLVLYTICVSLLHSLIIWFILTSLSPLAILLRIIIIIVIIIIIIISSSSSSSTTTTITTTTTYLKVYISEQIISVVLEYLKLNLLKKLIIKLVCLLKTI